MGLKDYLNNKSKIKLEKEVAKVIKKLPVYDVNKVYTTNVIYGDGIFYLKLYYENEIPRYDVDNVYVYALNSFLKVGYSFHGITEYQNNHEICLIFIRKEN